MKLEEKLFNEIQNKSYDSNCFDMNKGIIILHPKTYYALKDEISLKVTGMDFSGIITFCGMGFIKSEDIKESEFKIVS